MKNNRITGIRLGNKPVDRSNLLNTPKLKQSKPKIKRSPGILAARTPLFYVAAFACAVIVGTGFASVQGAPIYDWSRSPVVSETPTPTSFTKTNSAEIPDIPTPAADEPALSGLEPSAPAPVLGPVVVTIGDSIMMGHGLPAAQAWPALLANEKGWQLTNLASDGSGFVATGSNGDTFADQAAAAVLLKPDVVIFSGSSNDLGVSQSRINAAAMTTITNLHSALPNTRIMSINSTWGDTDAPSQMADIDAGVMSATDAVGGTYFDSGQALSGAPDAIQDDQVHPTADGQLMLARAVQGALIAAGVIV